MADVTVVSTLRAMSSGESSGARTVLPLTNPVRHYAWGSRTVLPRLTGSTAPAEQPWAEVWMGAHPLGPSRLPDGRSLADVEPDLPFLVKLLAADEPLSIQAHPDLVQARAGYAAEEASGVPAHAPERTYRDANHKPELLVALDRTQALCGFRSPLAIRGLAHGLGAASWAELVERTCGPGADDATALRDLLTETMTCAGAHLSGLVADVLAAGELVAGTDDAVLGTAVRWVRRLASAHPVGDPGVLAPLLLEVVDLGVDDGLFVGAGVLHSYLRGVGVEVQAASDNVVRGGLTAKHVDVGELLRTVRFAPAGAAQRVTARTESPGVGRYDVPVDDFVVWRVRPAGAGGTVRLATPGSSIVVCVEGVLDVEGVPLPTGAAAYVPAAGTVTVTGAGAAVVTSSERRHSG